MNLTQKQNYANIEFLTKDSADKISHTKVRIDGIKSKIDQLDDHIKNTFSEEKMNVLNHGYTVNNGN
jgi:predicted  nucleic acid-binding Zn-ribbon protein